MNQKQKILFIINPITGTHKVDRLKKLISEHIDHTKFDVEIKISEHKGHSREIAAKAINFKYLVAVGGDGTVNEIAGNLINSDIILGIIPNGSGNGLARELGIPLNIRKSLAVINDINIKPIDVGLANGQPFFCTAGVGFDAHIGKLFANSDTRGLQTYAKQVLLEYWQYRPQEYIMRFNGTIMQEKAFVVTIANAKQYGNNAFIAPQAFIDDGWLELSLIKPFPKLQLLDMGLRLFNKSINRSRFYLQKQINELEIENTVADCYHLDGEHYQLLDGKLTFSVVPKGVKVMVP